MRSERDIPESQLYDLLVCGEGPSGVTAVLAVARAGLSVLLVEARAQLGGTATSGLVSHWLGGRTQAGNWIVGGLFRSLALEADGRGCGVLPTLEPGQVYQPRGGCRGSSTASP
jgi:glycine/D-amino acid oxidase-like deaminating enzyme